MIYKCEYCRKEFKTERECAEHIKECQEESEQNKQIAKQFLSLIKECEQKKIELSVEILPNALAKSDVKYFVTPLKEKVIYIQINRAIFHSK